MPIKNIGYAADGPDAELKPWEYTIRDCQPHDVVIEVYYCGICHSDIHKVKNEWKSTNYPIVPGHEFTGKVVEVGSAVTKYQVEDRVAVGCMVDSCRQCEECTQGLEQHCTEQIATYNAVGKDGEKTYGGYGKFVIVNEDFVLKLSEKFPMDRAAPLLCAGITTYSPLKYNKVDRGGYRVGVIGLGGLGHMAVQFAVAMNNTVVVVSRTSAKRDLAMKLGASEVLISSDAEAMMSATKTLDFIIDTVSAQKPLDQYISLLKTNGIFITVGIPGTSLEIMPQSLIKGRRSLQGSLIGGIRETQEMLDFCAEHAVLPWIELIQCDYVNEAYQRVLTGDVHFRFVMDMKKFTFPTKCEITRDSANLQ